MYIMQETHDFLLIGHPDKNTLYAILAQRFYWLNMAIDIWQFTRNYDFCGVNMAWHECKYGLLKPLLVLDWKWYEISMDFIVQLLKLIDYKNIMMIINYLGKGSIIVLIK